jgi:hypothetical protein
VRASFLLRAAPRRARTDFVPDGGFFAMFFTNLDLHIYFIKKICGIIRKQCREFCKRGACAARRENAMRRAESRRYLSPAPLACAQLPFA